MSATIPFAASLGAPACGGAVVVQRAAFGAGGTLYRLGSKAPGRAIECEGGAMLDAAELRARGVALAADATAFPFVIGDAVMVKPHGEAAATEGVVRGVSDALGCEPKVFVGFRGAEGWRGAWFAEAAVAPVAVAVASVKDATRKLPAASERPLPALAGDLALWRAAIAYAEAME